MKRYLFLIALIAVAFLGWGNVTAAPTDILQECGVADDYWESVEDYVNYIENRNGSCCVIQAGQEVFLGILPVCTDQQNIDAGNEVPCNVSGSILNGDTNAIVTRVGILCKCKSKFGEYYDPSLNKVTCQPCSRSDVCCGVKLNTNVPFIGNCIEDEQYTDDPTSVSQEKAFPVLMSSLTKILVTVILIISFVLIVAGGIMIASAGANQSNASAGRKLIMKVVIGIALLGASGVILRLINPNFFG